MASNASGLNVATKAGEGAAHIDHWERFYGTLNYIQQQDLASQKMIVDAANKSALEVRELGKGIRPADVAKFKEYTDKFRETSMAAASKDVQRDPKKYAAAQQASNDAYLNAMNLADQSKEGLKFKGSIGDDVLKSKGVGYKSAEELKKLYEDYDKMPIGQLHEKGYMTPGMWQIPADTVPKADVDKRIFGGLTKNTIESPVYANDGKTVKGRSKHAVQGYENDIPTVANNTLDFITAMHDYKNNQMAAYERDMSQNPETVKQTIESAKKIVDALPSGGIKVSIPDGYTGYAVAKNILKAQPKDIGESGYTVDQEWKTGQDQAFKLMMQGRGFKNQKDMIQFKHSLGPAGSVTSINTKALYDAAKDPKASVMVDIGGGKKVPMLNSDVLDAGVQAMAAGIGKGTTGVTITRNNLVNAENRRRIIENLFPGLSQEEREDLISLETKMPQGAPEGEINTAGIKKILAKINSTFGQNITVDDVNRYGIPVFVKKTSKMDANGNDKISANATFVNPATNQYGQFFSTLSNQVAGKKKAAVGAEAENYIEILSNVSQDNEDDE